MRSFLKPLGEPPLTSRVAYWTVVRRIARRRRQAWLAVATAATVGTSALGANAASKPAQPQHQLQPTQTIVQLHTP